jgi:3-carboxy-cis,cis-muconate cycloisomerase
LSSADLLSPIPVPADVAEVTSDAGWLQAMLRCEAALARVSARAGLIAATDAETIAAVCAEEEFDPTELAAAAGDSANPVVPLVSRLRAEVTQRSASVADAVHLGATSQDILDTASMLVATRVLGSVSRALQRCETALAELATRHAATPMPGRTLTQQAVPISFGLKAAGYARQLTQVRRRVADLADGLPAQLGGAAGSLAALVEHAHCAGAADPERLAVRLADSFAAELGLAAPALPWHTARLPIADVGHACTLVTGAFGKVALDVATLARTEIGELSEPAAPGRGGSSAMPQKQNPVLSTLITSAARRVHAGAGVLTASLLAEDERPAGAWQAEWAPLRECLQLTAAAAEAGAGLVSGLVVDTDRMRADLDASGGAIMAERASVALGRRIGVAAAKEVLGRASHREEPLEPALRAELTASGYATEDVELDALFEPTGYLGASEVLIERMRSR